MKLIRKTIVTVLIGLILVSGWLFYDIQQFMHTPMPIPADGLALQVDQGSNLTRIAYSLQKQSILSNPRYLLWYARYTSQGSKIHVGEYRLTAGMSPLTLLEKIATGDVVQYSFTIVEGWNFSQLRAALQANEYVRHTLNTIPDDSIMQHLGFPGQHPEGRFLPDTYLFPRGIEDKDILQRAHSAMQTFLDLHWPQRHFGIAVNNPDEALILASIVEKETGLATERPAIAGVFTRRLQQRMRLQSDPTVIYGMGKRYNGNIRRRDLSEVTPYNTYTNFGLPPTPIAMPGREAILAVLQPQEGQSLYFVSRGDGSHHFSNTLEEHNEAVIRYQLKGRKRPFSSSGEH